MLSPTDMFIHKKPLVFWLNNGSIVCGVGPKVLCLSRFYFSRYLCNRLLLLPLREKLHLSGDVVKERDVGKDHSVKKGVFSLGP